MYCTSSYYYSYTLHKHMHLHIHVHTYMCKYSDEVYIIIIFNIVGQISTMIMYTCSLASSLAQLILAPSFQKVMQQYYNVCMEVECNYYCVYIHTQYCGNLANSHMLPGS